VSRFGPWTLIRGALTAALASSGAGVPDGTAREQLALIGFFACSFKAVAEPNTAFIGKDI
jgi:hypothetical protein